MFFKILKKDLKRNKSMNIILLLFMILIGMFISSSANMLYTETTALDKFMEKAKSAELMIVYNVKGNTDEVIDNWIVDNPIIKDYSYDEAILIGSENLLFPEKCNKYDNDSMIVLATQSEKHNLLFNDKDEILKVNEGEIAIPRNIAEKTGLDIGDKVTVSIEGISKEFTFKYYVKDATFGTEMIGFKRIVVSDDDYNFFNSSERINHIKILSCMPSDGTDCDELSKDFNNISVSNLIVSLTSKMTKLTYFPDLILAGIMMIVSIFLTIIAFLVLRFTIVFTLQEEYKEIGIMKAIGIKNKQIGNIYLIKYLAISVIGSAIGLALSIPFSNQMLKLISKNIVITKPLIAWIISCLSVLVIIFITLLFCMLCTRKINKFSAIDAIRNGTTGERFSKSKKINLHKHKRIKVPVFLAISDLVNGWKRFLILIITFVFGTILILVPINIINTIDSGEMLQYFGTPLSDVFIDFGDATNKIVTDNLNTSLDNIDKVEKKYSKSGENVELHIEAYYQGKIYSDNKNEAESILGIKSYSYSISNYNYLEGTAPKLSNEIAITQMIADYLGVGIGDTVYCEIAEKNYEFIVTALFQSMNNLGKSVRFSDKLDLDIGGYAFVFIDGMFINSKDIDKSVKKLKEITPEYDIESSKEFVSSMMGNVNKQIGTMRNVIIALVLGINFLITVLLVKMLVSKEIMEIAILKSMGFKNKTIKLWQVFRIGLVLICSVTVGTLIANNFGDIFISAIFKSFGIYQMKQYIIPQQVYFLYPLLVIIVTLIAVLLSLGQIRKTKVWEINNQE